MLNMSDVVFNEEEHSPLEVQEVFEQVEKLLKDLRK